MQKKKGIKGKKKTPERRRYGRANVKCRMRYQVTMEGNVSDFNLAESKNISQAGILINTNYPMPVYSTVCIEIESHLIQQYIKVDMLQNFIELENCPMDSVRIFGTVVRCKKVDDGSYDVGIHLVNK